MLSRRPAPIDVKADKVLVEAFYEAAIVLKDKIENDGWKKFSANYLREHVRCRFGYKFTNTLSPDIMVEVVKQHPELGRWIKTKIGGLGGERIRPQAMAGRFDPSTGRRRTPH